MIKKVEIVKFTEGLGENKLEDEVVEEKYVRIFINGKEVVVLSCLFENIDYLIYGFLFTQGIVKDLKEIENIDISGCICNVRLKKNDFLGPFWFISSECGSRHITLNIMDKVNFDNFFKSDAIFYLLKVFNRISQLYKKTGCVHVCGIAKDREIIIFKEDISRHNAFDKVIGEAILKNISLNDKILLTSGRITSEIIFKLVKMKIPVILSKGAPTDYAIRIGEEFGITIIGFARGKRFNIYTHKERIK
ncbi:MAG TPA: formate dehydrogenase accessory sulfurtransferase FdhD [bacterium]|nr:formate dehydrogenase accessory sulfurtransferase FdhD [bacterium]HOM27198.1 formate dehydrogenase accessory sulfurtransferase FdhD [bacterium]